MYYIAYGSNLNMEQMAYRCPSAEVVGTAVIEDYRLLFRGSQTGAYLTIEPSAGDTVPVAVWRVTEADIAALDRYEGFPAFYYKRWFNVACSDGKRHRVFGYIMHENRPIGRPSRYYVDTCVQGYHDFNFDLSFLEDAIAYSSYNRGAV